MGSYEEYLERSRKEFISTDDPDFHYHVDNLEHSRRVCLQLMDYRTTPEERDRLFEDLFGYKMPSGSQIVVPFNCDVGRNIRLGENNYFNYNCSILDVGIVTFGNDVMVGPNVTIIAVEHPRDADERHKGRIMGKDVTIGSKVWIGANAIIMPGVTIGDYVTIGAGSVVTHDVPSHTTVVGSPARPVKK